MNGSFLFYSKFRLKIFELLAEASIGLAAGPLLLQQFQTIIKSPTVFLHEVGNEQRRTSRNSSSTMHQHIPRPSRTIYPLVSRPKGVSGVLRVTIIEVEFQMDELLWIGEVQIHARTHRSYVVPLELGYIVSEIVTAYPNLAQLPLTVEHLLPLTIIWTETEH